MTLFADRVRDTTTTTGTGIITLSASPPVGSVAFSTYPVGTYRIPYAIVAVDGSGIPTGEWEVGYGTLVTATTLSRDRITKSSNAGASVNFGAGSKAVYTTIPADFMDNTISKGKAYAAWPSY
jgi:hypothetical protein